MLTSFKTDSSYAIVEEIRLLSPFAALIHCAVMVLWINPGGQPSTTQLLAHLLPFSSGTGEEERKNKSRKTLEPRQNKNLIGEE